MLFYENHLTILMNYHVFFFKKKDVKFVGCCSEGLTRFGNGGLFRIWECPIFQIILGIGLKKVVFVD